MRRVMTLTAMALFPVLILSCGGNDSVSPGSNPFGSGSNSLVVTAAVNGSEIAGGLYQTDFLVEVKDLLDAPVNDAVVTVTHTQLGTIPLVQDTPAPGTYKGTVSNYFEGTYVLNVTRGTDYVANGAVEAPDVHTIVSPTPGNPVSEYSPFTAAWIRNIVADMAEIETSEFGPTTSVDDGSFDIPASFNPRNDLRLTITRRNSDALVGGLPGSNFEAEIKVSVEPVVVGFGSNSLDVTANIDGADIAPGLFDMDFLITVKDAFGVPVSDAAVTVTHDLLGDIALSPDPLNPGNYIYPSTTYTQGLYTLTISRGTDFIAGAKVFAPDAHTISFPTTADTVDAATSFTAAWTRIFICDEAEIETNDFGPQVIMDDGSFEVPASFNPRPDLWLKIWRRNVVSIAGARPASRFRAEIRNSVEPIVVQ